MKQTIDRYQFRQAFTDYNRSDNFSLSGLDALFDYLQDYEDSTGDELELDVIALCCDWSEYDSAVEAATDLSDLVADEDEDEDDREQSALEYLRDRTAVLELPGGGVVVQSF